MPRKGIGSKSANTVPSADMAELRAALGAALSKTRIETWPSVEWTRLALACASKGYTLVVSPQMGGRGVRVSIPVGQGRLPIEAMTDQELLEGIRALILAVEKLPANE